MIMGSKGCSEQESAGCHFGTLGDFFMNRKNHLTLTYLTAILFLPMKINVRKDEKWHPTSC